MSDYNIYIHTVEGSSSSNKTKPSKKSSPTKPKKKEKNEGIEFAKALSKGNLSKLKTLGKVGIATAAIMIAAKKTDEAITLIEPFITQASGDYRFQIGYGNLKKGFHAALNPIGAAIEIARTEQAWDIAESRNVQARLLLGDSVVNDFGGRKE